MKKVMILGGGINQVPLIKKAKEIGLYVVLCDYYEINEGKEFADIHYVVSTHDYDSLLEIGRKEEIDGIVTNSEPVLHIVARLTDELELPSIGCDVMSLFLNKNLMRDHLKEKELDSVRYAYCHTIQEGIAFYTFLNKKIIMKPVDCSASKGVYIVKSEEDILENFDACLKNNRRNNYALLEEYIEGVEFTVDGLCVAGKHHTLAISRKKHFLYNESVANELFFSYEDQDFDYDVLRELNNKIAESTNLRFGMTHAEYKYEKGKFHFIEMAARGGGTFIGTSIAPFISDIDSIKHLILASVYENYAENFEVKKTNRCAVLRFFECTNIAPKTVLNIRGIDYLEKCNNVLCYNLDFKIGDRIKRAENDSERIGYYIAMADNRELLEEIMRKIEREFAVELGD